MTDTLLEADLLAPDLLGPDLLGPDLLGPDLLGPDLLGPDLLGPDVLGPGLPASASLGVRGSVVALRVAMGRVLAEPADDPRAAVELEVLLAVRAQLDAAVLARLAEVNRSGASAVDGARDQSAWLRSRARLSASDSRGSVRLARQLACHPLVAAQLTAGTLSAGHAAVCCAGLDETRQRVVGRAGAGVRGGGVADRPGDVGHRTPGPAQRVDAGGGGAARAGGPGTAPGQPGPGGGRDVAFEWAAGPCGRAAAGDRARRAAPDPIMRPVTAAARGSATRTPSRTWPGWRWTAGSCP